MLTTSSFSDDASALGGVREKWMKTRCPSSMRWRRGTTRDLSSDRMGWGSEGAKHDVFARPFFITKTTRATEDLINYIFILKAHTVIDLLCSFSPSSPLPRVPEQVFCCLPPPLDQRLHSERSCFPPWPVPKWIHPELAPLEHLLACSQLESDSVLFLATSELGVYFLAQTTTGVATNRLSACESRQEAIGSL